MQENWRPVVGYEGLYEVSDQGRVRSVDRWIEYKKGSPLSGRWFAGKVLRLQRDGNAPYLRIQLGHGNPRHTVHALVAAAFIGPRPTGLVVCHNNGDSLDNRAANLRYDTQSSNILDCVAQGKHAEASKTHCPQGHAYIEGNIKWFRGSRRCRTCAAADAKARYRRKRDAA